MIGIVCPHCGKKVRVLMPGASELCIEKGTVKPETDIVCPNCQGTIPAGSELRVSAGDGIEIINIGHVAELDL